MSTLFRGILVAVSMTSLTGCTTSLKYHTYATGESLSATAFRFSLPDSKITLAPPAATAPADKPAGNGGATASNNTCAASTTDANWWTCLNGISAAVAMSPPGGANPTVYVATPADSATLGLVTTAITGAQVSGQDTLYSSVTIKYTNNTSSIISAGSTGAVAGAGLAGPYGLVAGFFVGAVGQDLANNPGAVALTSTHAAPSVNDYLCPKEPVTFDGAKSGSPTLYAPVVIAGADARPIASADQVGIISKPGDQPSACWHALPNTGHVADATPVIIGAAQNTQPRPAGDGDGWLYRLVAIDDKDNAPTRAPAGAISTIAYFNAAGARQDFPYPVCRKAHMQITWWKEFNAALAAAPGAPTPRIVTVEVVVADPAYVMRADIKKGAVINFRPDCGATVSLTPDASGAAILNATVTATEAMYKAEQSWAAAQKKK